MPHSFHINIPQAYSIPSIKAHVMITDWYLPFVKSEVLIDRPHIATCHHRHSYLSVKKAESGCRIPGALEYLPRFDDLERTAERRTALLELLNIFDGEPPRSPEDVGHVRIIPVSIKMDWCIEPLVRTRDECLGDKNRNRPLILNHQPFTTPPAYPDIHYPSTIGLLGHESARSVVTDRTGIAHGVTRKLSDLSPLFIHGSPP